MRRLKLRGRAAGVKRWIVADMDDTLVRKLPHGTKQHTSLATSPCFEPLNRWLAAGNGLIVVTSDDGFRPFSALWEPLPIQVQHCEFKIERSCCILTIHSCAPPSFAVLRGVHAVLTAVVCSTALRVVWC